MTDWEDAAKNVAKGLTVLGLSAITGDWVSKKYDALLREAKRWEMEPDKFLLHMLDSALNESEQMSGEEIDELREVNLEDVSPKKDESSVYRSPDWSKADDDWDEEPPKPQLPSDDQSYPPNRVEGIDL